MSKFLLFFKLVFILPPVGLSNLSSGLSINNIVQLDSSDTKVASQSAVKKVLNSQKSENTQTSEVNSNCFLEICWKHDTSLQLLGIMILVLFTVPFYHFLFLRYLVLAEHHFLSDNLVPFSNSCNLYIQPCAAIFVTEVNVLSSF